MIYGIRFGLIALTTLSLVELIVSHNLNTTGCLWIYYGIYRLITN